jgi:hypothetical protein
MTPGPAQLVSAERGLFMNEWHLIKRFGQAFGLCLRVGLMKEWLPAVRFISFIRPTLRQRPEVVVARAVSVK